MSIPTRVAASVLMVLAGTLSPAPAQAEFKIAIWHDDDDLAQAACLASLRDMAPQAGIPDMSISSEARDSGDRPAVALHLKLNRELNHRNWHAISVIFAPFAIRDAAHFQKFVDSDLERELKAADWSNEGHYSPWPWLAVAYGGYFQLFSRDRAMTEPKHFVEQLIGGTTHARLYEGVKAKTFSLTYSRGMQQAAFSPHDITQMAERGNLMAAVEVATLDARSSGVSRVAKFANLTFTAVNAVVIAVAQAEQFLDLPPALQTKITRWVRGAAQACSGANFIAEKSALDDLKRGGMTIVPVNRPAFVEAGWLYAMGWVPTNLRWTPGDFDRLVKLDPTPLIKRLPSSLVETLPPKERSESRTTTQTLEVERKKIIASAKRASVDTGFADLWSQEMGALAQAFRDGAERAQPAPSVQLAAQAHPPFDANSVKRLIEETVRSLDEWEIARNCAHSCLRPIQGLMTAARASAEIGDTGLADSLIAKAEALVVRPHYQHATQVQELVAIAQVRMAMRASSTRAAVDRAAAVALAAESSSALTILAGHYRVLGVNDKRVELLSKVQALAVANGWFVDGLAEELERGGNRQAAVALMADALGSTHVASQAGMMAMSAERIWPPLAPITAATFARLSAIQRANASRVPRAPVAGVEPLETDWMSTLSSAVARWRAAGDIAALSKAKAELTATPAASTENQRGIDIIDRATAMIHAARGDIAASRAADGGKFVDEQDQLKRTREQAADKAALPSLLKQAEGIPDKERRFQLLREVVVQAAKIGDFGSLTAISSVLKRFDSEMWLLALRTVRPE